MAGVSLNAIIGDNGIITNAMTAKLQTALASLQDDINYLKVTKMGEDSLKDVELIDFCYESYPATGFLHRVTYGNGEIYVFDMDYISRLNKDLTEILNGGRGVDGTIYQLKDVYGINENFEVWYRDKDGKLYGVDEIKEVLIDPDTKVKMSLGLMESMGLTEETASVGNTRGKTNLEIDGSKMTEELKNLNDLALMPYIKWLKLKNLNLTDIKGLQYLVNLEKITFDKTEVVDLSGLKYASLATGFYLINGSVKDENMKDITSMFDSMKKLEEVRIRNNDGLTKIPNLSSLGNLSTLRIEENKNLKNIFGLSTVKDKSHLINLYLNENNLTDVVNNVDKDSTYEYVLPLLDETDNVINMAYLDGFVNLEKLICDGHFASGTLYEDGILDDCLRNQNNIHYLSGQKKDGSLLGINNLKKLNEINFENCDLFDINILDVFDKIDKIYFSSNNNILPSQVNHILSLLNNAKVLTLNGDLKKLLGNNKVILSYSNCNLIDVEFLRGNTVTKDLDLSDNTDLKNCDALGTMIQLTTLKLRLCNKVENWDFLNNLCNLVYLDVHGTNISDEVLENFHYAGNLEYLSFSYASNIDNLDFVVKYKNALNGYVYYNCLNIPIDADISVLNKVFSGNSLWICGGDLRSIQPCLNKIMDPWEGEIDNYGTYLHDKVGHLRQYEECTELEKIIMRSINNANIFRNENDSLNLEKLISLKKLYLEGVSIETLNVIGASNLEKVTIRDMLLGNYWKPCDFSHNNKLDYLNLSKNCLKNSDFNDLVNMLVPKYSDDEVISGCPLLKELYLNENEFSAIDSVSKLTTLEKLDLSDNQLISLVGIETLVNLEELDIKNNMALSNIKPIIDLMKNKKNVNSSSELKVYISGCSGITDELCNQMTSEEITVIK